VGEITAVDPTLLRTLQKCQYIPVISPIGQGENQSTYNINADVVAGKVAEALGAEKLIMMTNTPGVLDQHGKLLRELSPQCIKDLVADGTINAGMLPKIASSLRAVNHGVQSVHIVDGRVPHCLLLETLSDQGVGTTIRAH
jgi:acetylglutamate kinase